MEGRADRLGKSTVRDELADIREVSRRGSCKEKEREHTGLSRRIAYPFAKDLVFQPSATMKNG